MNLRAFYLGQCDIIVGRQKGAELNACSLCPNLEISIVIVRFLGVENETIIASLKKIHFDLKLNLCDSRIENWQMISRMQQTI